MTRLRRTHEDFVQEINSKHCNKIKVLGKFTNTQTKILLKCNKCSGEWAALPSNILSGKGCLVCCGKAKKTNAQYTLWLSQISSNKIIAVENYISDAEKIKHKCHECDLIWETSPHYLKKVPRCPGCHPRIKSHKQFLSDVYQIHGDKITVVGKYTHSHDKLDFKCTKCDKVWTATAGSIINYGSGCPYCCFTTSKIEAQWLDQLIVPNDNSHRQVKIKIQNKRYNLDGYEPSKNIVYEFLGDFWHGNPAIYRKNDLNKRNKKTFGQLFDKTKTKFNELRKHGLNVIYVWESDFRLGRLFSEGL